MNKVIKEVVLKLIGEKEYEAGRAVLKTLEDDAEAIELLERLNRIAPEVDKMPIWEYCRVVSIAYEQSSVDEKQREPTYEVGALIEVLTNDLDNRQLMKAAKIVKGYSRLRSLTRLAEDAVYGTIAGLGEDGWEVISLNKIQKDEYFWETDVLLKRSIP